MNWMLDILITHRRLKGLTEAQLRELIEKSDDLDALRMIKEHLERGSFKYPHIERVAPELILRCVERAKELLWRQNEPKVRKAFFDTVDDPFALPQ